ncbi:phosphopantothenoylcysteine decarboxylase isoform X4 [Rhinolophus sinicus]|uniref:phosphopantothenoylcysteine decarboxylase isoform X4 n=1 Tax=Rhinolophus sinicus TaxID=89399 RepID=UPI003D79EB35
MDYNSQKAARSRSPSDILVRLCANQNQRERQGPSGIFGGCAQTRLARLEVAVVTTERAKHFYSPQDIPVTLYSDTDEWEMWKCRSDPVLHIHLRRWADLMLVAPLDANTLGKVASGICDNLLTCVIRAWDLRKPLLFCPAMNTAMWEHPITSQQVGQLKGFGYVEIPCVAKKLVCGDQGLGAMAEVDTIVDKVKEVLSQHAGFQQS